MAGKEGDFSVSLRGRPRYIDLDACTGCRECADHCPVSVLDPFNVEMTYRAATYISYARIDNPKEIVHESITMISQRPKKWSAALRALAHVAFNLSETCTDKI